MEELFKKFFSDINPCDYVNYGLGAFGAIGVIYTIVSYYQSRRRQKTKSRQIMTP